MFKENVIVFKFTSRKYLYSLITALYSAHLYHYLALSAQCLLMIRLNISNFYVAQAPCTCWTIDVLPSTSK